MTSPLSSSRFAQVIARYGISVTITKRQQVMRDKPWLTMANLTDETEETEIAETATGASDELMIKARALIQEPRFIRQPEISGGESSRQIQQALIEVSDISAEALSAAILQTAGKDYLISRPSLIAQQGEMMIFKVDLLAQKGRL